MLLHVSVGTNIIYYYLYTVDNIHTAVTGGQCLRKPLALQSSGHWSVTGQAPRLNVCTDLTR